MSGKRYTEEFKRECVRQVTESGHSTAEVARRLGLNKCSLYDWVKQYGAGPKAPAPDVAEATEIRRLRNELKRVTEERDILKKAATYFAKESG